VIGQLELVEMATAEHCLYEERGTSASHCGGIIDNPRKKQSTARLFGNKKTEILPQIIFYGCQIKTRTPFF
jgi:hypothetical protein